MDSVPSVPFSSSFRQPLVAALRGERCVRPCALSAEEVRAIVEHGIAPLVYAATAAPELRGEAIRAAAQESLRASDLAEVLRALAAAGVEPLLMKGAPLAYGLYASPDLRPRGDTDLLISRDDLPRVRAAMLALGCDERPSSGDEHGMRQAIFTRPSGAVYDVHWAATNIPVFDAVLHYDELRTRAVAVPELGPYARALSRVDALLLACIHRVAHHHDSDRLIWLVDIALLRERMSSGEHESFWSIAVEGRVAAVCAHSIEVAEKLVFGRRAEGIPAFGGDEPSRVFLDRELSYGGVLASSLRALPWPARIERLWQLAVPPAEFMRRRFGARRSLLLPSWYVYRGVCGVARLFRRARTVAS